MSIYRLDNDDWDFTDFRETLNKHLICSICGQPKTHHRLYGYRCDNPEHKELEDQMWMEQYWKRTMRYWK